MPNADNGNVEGFFWGVSVNVTPFWFNYFLAFEPRTAALAFLLTSPAIFKQLN